MTHLETMDPHQAFAELGRIRLADIDIDALLNKIAQLAKSTIPGADEVSVTLLHGDSPQTAAFTGELARALDEKQYQRGYGPCLDAADTTTTQLVPDTTSEQRWPDWAADAEKADAYSSLSIGLPVHEHVTGALNIYATVPDAFDDDAVAIAQTFAGFAAVGLANAHLYETQATLAGHMQKAMDNRAVIEQAKGIIMGDRRCTAEQAFAILAKLSQDSNRKLRDVASALVENAHRPRQP
ncbi:GAF and ANTAR domain-containing protein [Actinoplanes xinjiangensis]|uniref:GAF domain-containing protein n=1 Tax=Actinoplanes xinjiangensis TaxID=512350 RepID=A0A316F894_9ACTN|nr:GAF and ANTAR domain-containing protein [Actinoplanes xinjiangensis]PWK43413.1 GAF domain-containing protein [Actinoplanes xinjiangensis]GIF41730.1 transcriptional regulator [Actinoplanes xinjiangensis]